MSMSTDHFEVRLRAVEFLLVHLISTTRKAAELKADRDELQQVAEGGHAWRLMPEISRQTANDVVEAAIKLLDDARFQQHKD